MEGLAPSAADSALPDAMSAEPVVVGRRRQRQLDVRLALGDISQTAGRAVLLGLFNDVRPSGAAVSIDSQIGGMIAEIVERRMFAANLGEVFVLPTPRGACGPT